LSIRSTIWPISSTVSERNTTVASIRLRNSGRKFCLSSAWTFSFMSSYDDAARAASVSPIERKPSDEFVWIFVAPRFEVMTMIVFRKSTRRPLASVSCPSSRIWSRMLNTSGCAFSTSSRRITA
jgi:hypothetical protein